MHTKSFIFKGLLVVVLFTSASSGTFAQDQASKAAMTIYRETPAMINELVHTRLAVSFDYPKRYMYGREWLTLMPHAYPTDSLRLDAKGMDIKKIAVLKGSVMRSLAFGYDSLSLAIRLDKTYRPGEAYTIYIDYTAKPDQLKAKGSAAINDAKGLYFINPDGKDPEKPVQIWTQGETESSSAWFPTIDKPSQKTTEEISMTVPSKYVTLSNGRLASQQANADGTRTDTWKMEQRHSPYLFMMAVGDFKITKDVWRGKEVSYYLEPKYAPYARQIFGMTPELLEFYSNTLGVEFPWNKYAQIVVRDYVSGAMENTSATLHGQYVQGTDRELLDQYYGNGRSTIAHELFHQWFGDYVTAESWSNLTVNESFADFSEMLWAEHKYGQDEADAHAYEGMKRYLADPSSKTKKLVRFHYADREDMFDNVTYQKGGRILAMLRNFLGRDAFYKGLKIYLTNNAFKNAEAQQLRLALEEASGRDLNWFFNQWYYGAGNPELSISSTWDEATGKETIIIRQTQAGQVFSLPLAIDLYTASGKTRKQAWLHGPADTLIYKLAAKPDLVNVDGDKILLALKNESKSQAELLFQYQHAPLYLDRFESVDGASAADPQGRQVLSLALGDRYYGLRIKAMRLLKDLAPRDAAIAEHIRNLAATDSNTLVKAAALDMIAGLGAKKDQSLFESSLGSRSYAIQGAALKGLFALDSVKAIAAAGRLEQDSFGPLTLALLGIYEQSPGPAHFAFVQKSFKNADLRTRFQMVRGFAEMIGRLDAASDALSGIKSLEGFGIRMKAFPRAAEVIISLLDQIKARRLKLQDLGSAQAASAAQQAIKDAR